MVRPCVGVMVKQYSLLEGGKMVIPVSISTPYLPPQIGRIHSGLTSTLPSHTSEVHRNYQSFFPTYKLVFNIEERVRKKSPKITHYTLHTTCLKDYTLHTTHYTLHTSHYT